MSVAVGIDLGTTNTVVGVVRDGRAMTLADEGGRRLIPSIVSFHPSGKVLVGEAAKERRIVDPQHTIYSVKRLIGRTWDQEEVHRARRSFPFELVEGPKKSVTVIARGETYTLPEISAFVLRRAKSIAEAALGDTVDRAVITVPANFNDLQRAATKLAGKLAGLEVLRILNEPTAAALAYGQTVAQHERIAVYDLGGGTFDITLLDLSGNVFEVLATGGDSALGGDDIDNLVAEQMAMLMLRTHRVDPRTDPTARATLRARAEILKMDLSSRDVAKIDLNDIVRGEQGVFLPFAYQLTRAELEQLATPLVERTLDTCRFSIETIGVKLAELDRVILVGGSTRMPLVVRKVEEFFKKPATGRVNPDEVVALGAAIQAAALSRMARGKGATLVQPGAPAPPAAASSAPAPAASASRPSSASEPPNSAHTRQTGRPPLPSYPLDIPPPPDWVGTMAAAPPPPDLGKTVRGAEAPEVTAVQGDAPTFDFELNLPKASPTLLLGAPPPPANAQSQPAPAGAKRKPPPPPPVKKPPPHAAPPPELPAPEPGRRSAPAAPAPAQAPSGAPMRERAAPLLIDVTPISLGVETAGGFTDVLIAGNTPVPCDRTRVFMTASDNQTAVCVRVAQGESQKFEENTELGELELTGLRKAARGEVRVAVTFEIDADGILNVKAKDVDSGRETVAKMHLLGAQTDAQEVAAMVERQRRHAVG